MRSFFFPLLLLLPLSICLGSEDKWPDDLNQSLQLYNNGQLMESYSLLKSGTPNTTFEKEAKFLLALAKWKMMWLSTYSPEDKKEVLDLLNRVDGICIPAMGREPDARFYYAASLGVRAQILATEGDWWATAKLGKQMKLQAQFLIENDPNDYKAYYLLGSYNYFADALPGYVKFLRTLLFLPGGDRAEGSKQLITAYQKGGVVEGEAGRTLAAIYTYFEHRHDYGLQMCNNILAIYPENYETGLNKGVNLYFSMTWEKSIESLQSLQKQILSYSAKHVTENDGKNKVVPCYSSMEREVRYWISRNLIQMKQYEEAREILMGLANPEIHQPYWLMRGVFLSLAWIEYESGNPEAADARIRKVLLWQDVKDSHDKAALLKKKTVKLKPFDIDLL